MLSNFPFHQSARSRLVNGSVKPWSLLCPNVSMM